VNGSARFSVEGIFATTVSPYATISLMRWYLPSMCFPLLWFLGSLDCVIAPLLSQNNVMGDYSILITPRFVRNFLSQTTSFAASPAAKYLGSIVESAMHDFLTLLLLE
jgi:hypothetical protein